MGLHVGVLEGPLDSNLEVWERLGRPSWGPWKALGLQVGVHGRLNEAPKQSFGPPKSVAKRLRMHFCNVMKNHEKHKENQSFCMVFPMLRGLQKALGPPS